LIPPRDHHSRLPAKQSTNDRQPFEQRACADQVLGDLVVLPFSVRANFLKPADNGSIRRDDSLPEQIFEPHVAVAFHARPPGR
jgi:hypothetical protein